jgi:hypothetical protein
MLFLARIVRLVAMIVAGVLVAGILLFVLGANQSNEIVSAVMDAGRWLAGPFDGLFSMDSAKWELAINWGIAAAVYSLLGNIIAGLLARAALAGERRRDRRWHFGRRRPVA